MYDRADARRRLRPRLRDFLGAVELELAWPPVSSEPGPLRNLFLLDPCGLFLASFLAVLTSWTIVHPGRWIHATSSMRRWRCPRSPAPWHSRPARPESASPRRSWGRRLYTVFGADHFCPVQADSCPKVATGLLVRPTAYLDAWQDVRSPRTPETDTERRCRDLMIVVAASGGGRTAAFWTGTVLSELQQRHPECFAERIARVSTASGGGVGAMYFIEAFRTEDGRVAQPADSGAILRAAGHPSLSAFGWGLVYPDLLRPRP